jgi:hypothetical protein
VARVKVIKFNAETLQRHVRQREYMARVGKRLRAEREQRRKDLSDRRLALERAVATYHDLDRGEDPFIGVRGAFVRLGQQRPERDDPELGESAEPPLLTDDDEVAQPDPVSTAAHYEVSTRPPLTRLIHRQTNALRLLLTAIYVAHVETPPRRRFVNHHGITAVPLGGRAHSWAKLCGLADGSVRARRARVTRALDELARHQLVALGKDRQRYEGFELLSEDGSERPYRRPNALFVQLPAGLFYNGWHLVLTPAEMATYLIVRDAFYEHDGGARRTGVAIPEILRYRTYGLSGEVYASIHELQEFGLIEIIDTMPNRRGGKVKPTATNPGDDPDETGLSPVPYRFTVSKGGYNQDALTVVENCLATSPLPPRLAD